MNVAESQWNTIYKKGRGWICLTGCALPTPALGPQRGVKITPLPWSSQSCVREVPGNEAVRHLKQVMKDLGHHAKVFWLYSLVWEKVNKFSALVAAAGGNRLFHWQEVNCFFLIFMWNPVLPEALPLHSFSTLILPLSNSPPLTLYQWG